MRGRPQSRPACCGYFDFFFGAAAAAAPDCFAITIADIFLYVAEFRSTRSLAAGAAAIFEVDFAGAVFVAVWLFAMVTPNAKTNAASNTRLICLFMWCSPFFSFPGTVLFNVLQPRDSRPFGHPLRPCT